MKQIHALFAGTGTREEVLKAATNDDARFYAHLYLALYEEALGHKEKSLEHIHKAVKEYGQSHYMGDVARVHLDLRSKDGSQP